MDAISEALVSELSQGEFSEGYAESFLDVYIATQLKVLREQRGLTQTTLANMIGTHQTVISRAENVNYSAWNIGTLKKLARAFEVRLKVSFEEYGTLPRDVESFSREKLKRFPRSQDPRLLRADPKSFSDQLLAAAASYESVIKYSYEAGRFWRTALANAPSHPQEESEPNVTGHPPTVTVQVHDAAQVHDAISQATQQPAPQPKDPYKGLTLVTETKVMETINPPMEAAA